MLKCTLPLDLFKFWLVYGRLTLSIYFIISTNIHVLYTATHSGCCSWLTEVHSMLTANMRRMSYCSLDGWQLSKRCMLGWWARSCMRLSCNSENLLQDRETPSYSGRIVPLASAANCTCPAWRSTVGWLSFCSCYQARSKWNRWWTWL